VIAPGRLIVTGAGPAAGTGRTIPVRVKERQHAEDIPWRYRRLVIGTGADGALPVMRQVREKGRRRKVALVVLPTAEAISALAQTTKDIHAILHLTC
jgi:hypothetical protein